MFQSPDGQLLECYYCSLPNLTKFGVTSSGAQRYRCNDCRKTFIVGGRKLKYNSSQRANILNHCDLFGARKTARVYKVSTNTIRKWKRESELVEKSTKKFYDLNYIPEEEHTGYRITNI